MYLQFYINENGDKKETPVGLPTQSAHPARFSPDDKYSRQRVLLKKRFGLLPTQMAPPKLDIVINRDSPSTTELSGVLLHLLQVALRWTYLDQHQYQIRFYSLALVPLTITDTGLKTDLSENSGSGTGFAAKSSSVPAGFNQTTRSFSYDGSFGGIVYNPIWNSHHSDYASEATLPSEALVP
ncbi:hypothetical protein ZIOFF_015952 [Zingiber officinale]|uniref:Nucleolar protein 10 n=1 Tax=Zingiber officinale TaxID=94328 RepID=A0A8J5I142_ZINOF|nr:hypothetical protein ZIOFF_015952 [Zingiber officinale]